MLMVYSDIKSRNHDHHYKLLVLDSIRLEEGGSNHGTKALQQSSILQFGYSADVELRFNWLRFLIETGL